MQHKGIRKARELSADEKTKLARVALGIKRLSAALYTTDTDFIAERAGALCARIIKLAEAAGCEGVTAAVFRHLEAHDGREETE